MNSYNVWYDWTYLGQYKGDDEVEAAEAARVDHLGVLPKDYHFSKFSCRELVNLIVAGSRNFNDYKFLEHNLNLSLSKKIREDVTFICGMAKGADLLGLKYAKQYEYDWLEFPADWYNLDVTPCVPRYHNGKLYNAAAGNIRNKLMAEHATHLLAFWDGKSTGTKDMIDIAKRKGLIVRVVHYEGF